MLSKIKAIVALHISKHITLYFMIILCFSIGIASGVFSVKALSQMQKEQLIDYLVSSFKATLVSGQINSSQIFVHSLLVNLKTLIIIWLLAVSVFGFPVIFLTAGARGFSLGFTIGFLIENIGYKGILFCIVSILPQNLVIIPVLLALCVVSISYSVDIIRNRKANKYVKKEKYKLFLKYNMVLILLFIIMMFGSLIEGYISPIFLKGILGYLLG